MGTIRKQLYQRPDLERKHGKIACNVHLLEGYNSESLTAFQRMARILRKDFPQAKPKDIGCGKVHKSSSVYGYSIVAFFVYLSEAEIAALKEKGWWINKDGRMEYCW